MTDRIYSTDAYARAMEAIVVGTDTDDGRVLLDRTVFYPGGGGQPHDTGTLNIGDDRLEVVRVTQDADGVWHWIEGSLPGVGTALSGHIDWDRRYRLMRTHTALHALCGVVWNRFHSPVTGGNMQPGEGRLDFDIPDWTAEELPVVERELNEELARRRAVEVSFLPRNAADEDPSLIRTKVNLLPPTIEEVRVIDIVGLDRQADGGTHVGETGEVGRITIPKAENKGRGFRRIRVRLDEDS
ncbi:MAG: alanyl-tRNA editing protein [Deltaproteobacteria bacterium]|jgi:misacylated tRNA(Ala) deacylase|nr:alanyl-tRNA editing protein [Deltaproteobacteria bacterium]